MPPICRVFIGSTRRRREASLRWSLTALCLVGMGCDSTKGGRAMPSTAAFDRVDPGSGKKNACTPQVEDDFLGIRIAAPEKVVYKPGARKPGRQGFARIMICGIYRLSSAFLEQLGGGIKTAGLLVAVDTATHRTYSGKMLRDHPIVPNPFRRNYTAEQLAQMER